MSSEVIVVGGGLIGLAVSAALAERGVEVTLFSQHRPGEASPAAAGMLAPSVERAPGPAHQFGIAARDRYASYVEFLAERTGVKVPLNRLGILQVAFSEKGIKGLRKSALPTTRWLDAKELHHFELALPHALGAMFNAQDGAVDNVVLLQALNKLCSGSKWIERADVAIRSVKPRAASCAVATESGKEYSAAKVVLAAGAWAGKISGARFAKFVKPARGQLVSYFVTSPTGRAATSCLAVRSRSRAARWKMSASMRARHRRVSKRCAPPRKKSALLWRRLRRSKRGPDCVRSLRTCFRFSARIQKIRRSCMPVAIRATAY